MARTNIPPVREAELVTWATQLSQHLNTTPGEFGTDLATAEAYDDVVGGFVTAYQTANNPPTRSKPFIEAKNVKKNFLVSESRKLIAVLQAWPGMTNEKRDILEIPRRGNEPTPIGPPTVMPVLRVASVEGNVINLELRRADGTTRSKPEGVRSARLFSFVGANPPSDLPAWTFDGGTTKSDPQITVPAGVAPGSVVWVAAMWVNPRDQPGPACAPVKTHTNFAGMNAAA